MRKRLNLTIHPEIREFAEQMAAKRRRSISQIFEELVEAEWERQKTAAQEQPSAGTPPPTCPQRPAGRGRPRRRPQDDSTA